MRRRRAAGAGEPGVGALVVVMGWMAPFAACVGCRKLVAVKHSTKGEPPHMEITTIGLDLAKHVFQVHGVDEADRTVRSEEAPARRKSSPSSGLFRRGSSASRRAAARTTGRGSSRSWATRCG